MTRAALIQYAVGVLIGLCMLLLALVGAALLGGCMTPAACTDMCKPQGVRSFIAQTCVCDEPAITVMLSPCEKKVGEK